MVTATIASLPAAAGAKGASPAKAQPGFQDALRQAMSTREAPKSEKSHLTKEAAGLWLAVAAQPYERVAASTQTHGGLTALASGHMEAGLTKTSLAAAGGTAPATGRLEAKDVHPEALVSEQAHLKVNGGAVLSSVQAKPAAVGPAAASTQAVAKTSPDVSRSLEPAMAKALAAKVPTAASTGEGAAATTVASLARSLPTVATQPGRIAFRTAFASTPAEGRGAKEANPSSAIASAPGVPEAATSLRQPAGAAAAVAAHVGGTSSLGSHGRGQAGNLARDGERGRQVAVPGTQPVAATAAAPRPFGTGPVDSASVAAQVAAVAQRTAASMESGPASVRLQLDPPELGHVQVTLRAAQDGIVAVLRAANPAAIALLQGGQEDLRQRLGALGFKTTSVEVIAADRPRIVVASSRSSAGRRRD